MFILKFIFILLEVLLLFNLLIVVHELGHFLAARWRGMVVDRFGIWFGKSIWEKKIGSVTYSLGCIPAGGYVSLPQMAPMEAIEGQVVDKQESYPPAKPIDKIIVAVAGPLFSFGLALVFALLVWGIGRPISETETTTTVGFVVKGSPAEAAGLLAGDKVLAVDGKPVSRFSGIGDSVQWYVVSSQAEEIKLTVERAGKVLDLIAKPVRDKTALWERKALREIQARPLQTPLVASVSPNSPAALGGLKVNDVVLEVNGVKLYNPEGVREVIRRNPEAPVLLKVQRGKEQFTVSIKPVMPEGLLENTSIPKEEKFPMLGVAWEMGGKMSVDHPNPVAQVKASVNAMAGTLGAVFSPKSDIKFQHLSGPVGIIRIYYRLFESEQGWRLAIWFSVVLNINLALLNLLPIPVLDGGHIVLSLVEAIRRKPIHLGFVEFVQKMCAILIIGYMLYVTFFDAQDLPWKKQKQFEVKFKPVAAAPARP
jgi:regulator of sigma E protease